MLRKKRWGIIVAVVLMCFALLLAGCAEGEKATKETEKSATPKEAGEELPEETLPPVKSLSDFPDGQDGDKVEAVIRTERGDIVIQFFPEVAPVTVASFLHLARTGFYNGTRFHRVEPGFVIQGGDPLSKNPDDPYVGTGGPGYRLPPEFSDKKHETGTVAMARAEDPYSGGSQFYICLAPQPSLDGQYTVFGQVVSGMDVVNSIQKGDLIKEVIIRPRSSG